ncbi:TetR family transcriptional regulator [Actinoplanes sp. ATCC 53533]|uniref:TetR/AcrR family transcriptional regulator n=1 Tax=Actinoplanes sp. ATCC 53533 TaxID=1288362 RepID=UPI000F79DF09|nr:TetR/AcrR family transcriptional regulator [Actinoplanes sp. ATCC 53533]RSM51296.1 TetR family transcriptional regulator [Actinoplanes sp. ATCC 53533]
MPAASPRPPQRVDGRTARSERTRNAIVDAHVALILSGDLRPTADRIAKQAGVSLRALWSHFADMEALFAASGERILLQRDEAHRAVPVELPLAARIDAYCHQRARLLEHIAPAAKASALKEPFSPALQSYRRSHVDRVRTELKILFGREINGDETLLAALTATSMWPTWGTMRDAMGLDQEAARLVLIRTVTALLAAR